MNLNEVKNRINGDGAWFDAEGNCYKLMRVGDEIYARVYRKARGMDGEKWIQREFYRLDPNLLEVAMEGELVKTEYRDAHEEPVYTGDAALGSFEEEADAEYEEGICAYPAIETSMFCGISFFESTPEEAEAFWNILESEAKA